MPQPKVPAHQLLPDPATESGYASTPAQILVLGDQAEIFDRVFASLAAEGVAAYRASDLSPDAGLLLQRGLTGVVLAIDAVVLPHKKEQKVLAQALTDKLHGLLPLLAQPAQMLVLARGGEDSSGVKLDRMLTSVIGRISQEATTEYGVNLSINALDVTGTVDAALIAERVIELFDTREEIATGQVLDYDEIVGQSIRCALALRFVY